MTTDRNDAGSGGERIGGVDAGMLIAYADGVLAPEEARRLEAAIRDDTEAQEALALMRRSAAAVRHAFDAPLDRPVPERLRAVFDRPSAAGSPSRPWLSQRLLPLAASIAALAVGLAVGFGGGTMIGAPETGGQQIRLAAGPADSAPSAFDAALLRALEGDTAVTRYTDDAGVEGTVTLLGRLNTSFGVPCREFRHAVAGTAGSREESGLACRRVDGGWEVSILTPSAAPPDPS
jgi:surface antigen